VVSIPVSDPDNELSELTFIAGALGTNVVQSIVLDAGTNGNSIIATITLRPNAAGTETVAISVFDGENLSRASFQLEVLTGNAPVIDPIANVETPEDISPSIRITVTDADTPLNQLVITGEASNTNLVRSVTITGGTNATVNLVANAFGVSTITIRATDGTNATSASFTLTVVEVPECPTIGVINNQTVNPGTTTVRVPLSVIDNDTPFTSLNFIGGAAGGTAKVQSITFERTATTVTAVITLQPGATGSETITVRVIEGECPPSTQSFTLNIAPVNPTPGTVSIGRQGTNLVLNVSGDVGATYAIEATSNFQSWTQIGTVTIEPDGTTTVTIPATGPYQFFRVRGGPAPAQAQAAVYEGFAYPAGTVISTNVNGGIGWAGAYTPDAENEPTNHIVLATGLEYGDGQRALITSPGSVFFTATTNNMASGDVRAFRTFAGGIRSTGTTWISFIGQRLGPTITNTGTPLNPYPRAANISFYEGTTERFAIGNGSGAVSNVWTFIPGGAIANVTNDQRSATPMNQQAFIVVRIDHLGTAAGADDAAYMWVNPPLGATPDVSTANARSVGAFNYSFDRIRPFVGGADTGNNRPYGELALDEVRVGNTFASVTPFVTDVTQPFNTIVLVNGTDTDTSTNAPPAAEGVARVIDNAGQKYLNFLEFNSGFIVTPLGGTVVNGLRFWTANDAVERDPASYKLEGSNDGTTWTTISEGALNLPLGRNAGGATTALRGGLQEIVRFSNATTYAMYRVTFPTVRNATAANSMQIAEVDFLSY